MPAQRPTLVASNSPIGDQLRAFMADNSAGPVRRCSFDECRQQLVWSKPGLLVLLAADAVEWELVACIAREAALRQSRLTVVIVYAAGIGEAEQPEGLFPPSATRFLWPTAAEEIAAAVRGLPECPNGQPADDLADRLLGLTPSLAPMAERLALAASHDLTVLLTGETGTGKTFLARLLHDFSPRRNHPFLMVPCGAQSANLFESCFFGHVKGAFTSAHQAQRGKFAAAGKGTILLDEIDTLGMEQQASLLRVIETGEYEQVGGHVTFRSEARLIAASNWDLEAAVEDGRLRQDLYYRINVLSFHLPALRERPQDVAPLTRAFAAHFSTRFNKQLCEITPEALAVLEAYPWPGNIRQLENTIQQAVLAAGGAELRAKDLPESVRQYSYLGTTRLDPAPPVARAGGSVNGRSDTHRPGSSLLQSRADYERHVIRKALEESRFNRSSAARSLGVSRVTLHKKIKQYGLADLA
jgi:DNA-binding NtrC family response regulator